VTTTAASHHPPARTACGAPFLIRRLHSLTGLVFGGYLCVHLIVNATLVEGVREGNLSVYQQQVNTIHSLPLLVFIECAFIYLPILFHTFYGIWVIASGQPNVDNYPYTKNWFYLLQRISAIILVFFMVFHVFSMKGWLGNGFADALKFIPEHATESTANHFNAAWWVWSVVYPVGILASCYHLANGFWTAAITWGLTISAKSQKRFGLLCTGVFFFTLACGMTALISLVHMGAQKIPASPAMVVR
jgi:succinate dehydrogenase / fumarate reductase cytochrome b subunit